jgi:hypothetical protein
MSNQNNNRDFLDYLGIPILILVIIVGMWFLIKPFAVKYIFLASPAFFKFSLKWIPSILIPHNDRLLMAAAIEKIPTLNIKAILKANSWHYFWMTISLWGVVLRLAILPLMAYQLYAWIHNVPDRIKYRYTIGLRKLAEQNAQQYPCVLPAIRADLAKKDPFVGTWKYPLTTIEFCMKHGLLIYKKGEVNERRIPAMGAEFARLPIAKRRKMMPDRLYVSLDVQRCDSLMRQQLGPKWQGLDALAPLERALAIAFMAVSLGGKLRDQAFILLDQISRTFIQASEDADGNITGTSVADVSGFDELRKKVEDNPHILEMIAGHAYMKTVFMRLLDRRYGGACSKGKLTPTTFHWLKPHNEDLWRTLHPVGGQEPWTESIAPWIHFNSEIKLRKAIHQPVIESATDSIIKCLHDEEWIIDSKLEEEADYEAAKTLAMLNNQGKTAR